MYGPAFKTDNASSWVTRSRQFYLQDDIVLNDTLKLGVGFKAVDSAPVVAASVMPRTGR